MDTGTYVCPNCGTNEDITEESLAWVGYRGMFNESGHVDMFDTETPMIGENPEDPGTYYVCECGHSFEEPITKEEYEELAKK